MKITLRWKDGETRDEYDVVEAKVSWVGDEWLIVLSYRDGTEDHFTGKDVRIAEVEQIDGQTYAVE